MKRNILYLALLFSFFTNAQEKVEDDFEGNGTITTWTADATSINTSFANPFKESINTSNTVLEYKDEGGLYANVRFDIPKKFDLTTNYTFTLKIYVPSSSLTGNQNNQISLKLQNNNLNEPWSTQSEIIKNIALDQWQTVSFNFKDDNYINLNQNSEAPINRNDFNRVLLQINGENNTDRVTAYIDDFSYDGTLPESTNTNHNFDTLVWSDEFDGESGKIVPIDNSKWFHQTQLPAGGSWYNNEVQHYTNRIENSFVQDGKLNIVAKKESFTDQGHTKNYTSARLNSKFAFTYGKVEVRAKLPTGFGTWPAIWMLGKNITEPGGYWTATHGTTPWPACGEIDIMEHWGKNQNYVSSAMHTPSSYGGTINHGGQTIPTVSTAFHVYELVWTPEKMVFSVDGNEHYTYNPSIKNADTWPFDADQYFLLNIAIESSGTDSSYTESAMVIDYIRVYQASSSLSTSDFDKKNDDLKLFPNPAGNKITLSGNHLTNESNLTVFDITGKKLGNFTQNEPTKSHDISYLSKGIYFLKIADKNYNKTIKFIKN